MNQSYKNLHEVIAAWRDQPEAKGECAARHLIRERFANFVFWEASAAELDALMAAIYRTGYVSTTERPKVAGVTK